MLVSTLVFERQNDFAIRDIDRLLAFIVRAAGNAVQALAHDAHALAHFFHANQVAIVAIADRANRHVELQILVNQDTGCALRTS